MNQLIQKYNYPVPRYTSYPPANFFHEEFTAEQYVCEVGESNGQSPQNLSFYIHVPFCPKLCYYCGCNSYSMAKAEVVKEYMESVKKEIKMLLPKIDKSRKISQIHYGGGTPTAIPLHYLKEINSLFFDSFECTEDVEVAIECHPGYLNESKWMQIIDAGFNRCSIGIQDFNDDVLNAVNRKPSVMPIEDVVTLLREHGVSVNLDFIYGLPLQSVEGFIETIQRAIDMKPNRLVTFSYAHVPWVNKNQLKLEQIGLPSKEDKELMFRRASEILNSNGYVSIGLDHFVLPSDELNVAQKEGILRRNFQGYCTYHSTGQVYGFGVTAISQLAGAYAQNIKDILQYIANINKEQFPILRGYKLSSTQQIVRELITTLMCNNRIVWSDLAKHFNLSVEDLKLEIGYHLVDLDDFAKDGLLVYSDDVLEMTEQGKLFVRNVAAAFDPLMKNKNAKNLYSRSV